MTAAQQVQQPFEKIECEGVFFVKRDWLENRRMEITMDDDDFHAYDEEYGTRIVEQLKPQWLRFDEGMDLSKIDKKWLNNRRKMEIYIFNNTLPKFMPFFGNVTKLVIETKYRVDAMQLVKSMSSISILKITGNRNTYCTEAIVDEIANRAHNLEAIHLELSKDSSIGPKGLSKLTYLPCTRGRPSYNSYGDHVAILLIDQPGNDLWDTYDFNNMPGFERCQIPKN